MVNIDWEGEKKSAAYGFTTAFMAIEKAAAKEASGAVAIAEGNIVGGASDMLEGIFEGGKVIVDRIANLHAEENADSIERQKELAVETAKRLVETTKNDIRGGLYGPLVKKHLADVSKAYATHGTAGAIMSAADIATRGSGTSASTAGDISGRIASGAIVGNANSGTYYSTSTP